MKPRLGKIVLVDWPALFCLLSIPGIWLIGLAFPLLRTGAEAGGRGLLAVAAPISLVAAGFLLWRIGRIHRLFRKGVPAKGGVTHVQFSRDRARVEFVSELKGQRFGSWMPLHQSREVLALRVSQAIEVLVDEAEPSRAIIRHMFV